VAEIEELIGVVTPGLPFEGGEEKKKEEYGNIMSHDPAD
jgi:hypothetical protein